MKPSSKMGASSAFTAQGRGPGCRRETGQARIPKDRHIHPWRYAVHCHDKSGNIKMGFRAAGTPLYSVSSACRICRKWCWPCAIIPSRYSPSVRRPEPIRNSRLLSPDGKSRSLPISRRRTEMNSSIVSSRLRSRLFRAERAFSSSAPGPSGNGSPPNKYCSRLSRINRSQ